MPDSATARIMRNVLADYLVEYPEHAIVRIQYGEYPGN